jgi:type IV pilus assembly protein PilX
MNSKYQDLRPPVVFRAHRRDSGASLIVVLILLVVITGLGLGAVQISLMGERGARNDRDRQVAWQAAESALMDAEFDMRGPGTATRASVFAPGNLIEFQTNCGTSGNTQGLCLPNETGKPIWLAVDFEATSSPAVVDFGTFTSRAFDAADATGLKPARKPRYIIEALPDKQAFGNAAYGSVEKFVYRVTAMGFGPRKDIQSVTQMVFRKE